MNKKIFVLKTEKNLNFELPDIYLIVRKDPELLCTWHLYYRKTLPSSYARIVAWNSSGYCYVTIDEADIKHKEFKIIIANLIKELTDSCVGIIHD